MNPQHFRYLKIWFSDFHAMMMRRKRFIKIDVFSSAFSWRGPFSYRNQSIDLLWFLFDNGQRHERVKWGSEQTVQSYNEKVDIRISANIHLGEDLLKTSSRRLRRPKIVALHYDKNRQPFCDFTIFWFIFYFSFLFDLFCNTKDSLYIRMPLLNAYA